MAKGTVVVIDDDEDLLEFMEIMLEDAGYQPVVSQDPEGATALIRQEQPVVAILDLRMGRRDAGLTILQELRADPSTLQIPVILYTGESEFMGPHRAALRELSAEILLKPFPVAEILARIAAVT